MIPEVLGKAHIIVKKGENEYVLVCNNNANLGEAYSAWQDIGACLVNKIQQDLESRKPVEAKPSPDVASEEYKPV
jgi:hypothetical protein